MRALSVSRDLTRGGLVVTNAPVRAAVHLIAAPDRSERNNLDVCRDDQIRWYHAAPQGVPHYVRRSHVSRMALGCRTGSLVSPLPSSGADRCRRHRLRSPLPRRFIKSAWRLMNSTTAPCAQRSADFLRTRMWSGASADMLVEQLFNGVQVRVIDATNWTILRNRIFSNQRPLGFKLLGQNADRCSPDAIISRLITQFGRDRPSHPVGGGWVLALESSACGVLGTSKSKAVVASRPVSYLYERKSLPRFTGRGKSTPGHTALIAREAAAGGEVSAAVTWKYNFANTILGEAVRAAVDGRGATQRASGSGAQSTDQWSGCRVSSDADLMSARSRCEVGDMLEDRGRCAL